MVGLLFLIANSKKHIETIIQIVLKLRTCLYTSYFLKFN